MKRSSKLSIACAAVLAVAAGTTLYAQTANTAPAVQRATVWQVRLQGISIMSSHASFQSHR